MSNIEKIENLLNSERKIVFIENSYNIEAKSQNLHDLEKNLYDLKKDLENEISHIKKFKIENKKLDENLEDEEDFSYVTYLEKRRPYKCLIDHIFEKYKNLKYNIEEIECETKQNKNEYKNKLKRVQNKLKSKIKISNSSNSSTISTNISTNF